MNTISSIQSLSATVYKKTIGQITQFVVKWLIVKHPPRGISRLRWKFDYYVGRNPLGPPYYGLFCIRNAYHNTGLSGIVRRKAGIHDKNKEQ